MYVYTHERRAHARGVLKNPVQGAHPRETQMSAYMRFRPLRLFLYVGIHYGMFCTYDGASACAWAGHCFIRPEYVLRISVILLVALHDFEII